MLIEYEAGGRHSKRACGWISKIDADLGTICSDSGRGKPFDPNDAANMKLFVEVSSR
jgi:hypothetical protein